MSQSDFVKPGDPVAMVELRLRSRFQTFMRRSEIVEFPWQGFAELLVDCVHRADKKDVDNEQV